MSKRSLEDDDAARKRICADSALLALPPELIETIALAAGPREYRTLAAACRRTRRLLTQDEARQERAKQKFARRVMLRQIYDASTAVYCLPNGVQHGVETTLDNNGQVLHMVHWADGKKHGVEKFWEHNGELVWMTHWHHGVRHGASWSTFAGEIMKGNYENGKKRGLHEHLTCDGVPLRLCNYANGLKHGADESFYPNGTRQFVTHYVDGQRHGLEQSWTCDGKLAYSVHWRYDQKHGVETHWKTDTENDEIDCVFHWNMGVLV